MALAWALSEYPVETRADLQRFFSLNIDDMGGTYSAWHAAACLACLPWDSALSARIRAAEQSRADDANRIKGQGVTMDEFMEWQQTEWKEVEACRKM